MKITHFKLYFEFEDTHLIVFCLGDDGAHDNKSMTTVTFEKSESILLEPFPFDTQNNYFAPKKWF